MQLKHVQQEEWTWNRTSRNVDTLCAYTELLSHGHTLPYTYLSCYSTEQLRFNGLAQAHNICDLLVLEFKPTAF